MNEIEFENLGIEFRKLTNIFDESFKKLNLKVLSVTYNISDNGFIECWVEISSISGNEVILPPKSSADEVEIKINFYINDRIISSESSTFDAKNFIGYDTIELTYYAEIKSLLEITSIKLYATLG